MNASSGVRVDKRYAPARAAPPPLSCVTNACTQKGKSSTLFPPFSHIGRPDHYSLPSGCAGQKGPLPLGKHFTWLGCATSLSFSACCLDISFTILSVRSQRLWRAAKVIDFE